MNCEGCTAVTLKTIPSDIVDELLFKQAEMRKELKRKPPLPAVVLRVLKEWKDRRVEK